MKANLNTENVNPSFFFSSSTDCSNSNNSSVIFSCDGSDFCNLVRSKLLLLKSFENIKVFDRGSITDVNEARLTNSVHIHVTTKPSFEEYVDPDVYSVIISNRIQLSDDKPIVTLCHQRHLAAENTGTHNKNKWNKLSQVYSLGKVRHATGIVEPIIRDSNGLIFDMNALRTSDAPDLTGNLPTGLYAEEACQLMRYAGESTEINSITICSAGNQKAETSAMLVGLMTWYAIEGRTQFNSDHPSMSLSNFDTYLVDYGDYTYPFYQHKDSRKWWMQSPTSSNDYVACSNDEYQKMVAGIPSPRLSMCLS